MRFTERIRHVVREDGLRGLLLYLAGGAYDRAVRPRLGASVRDYSGVRVRTSPSFWELLPGGRDADGGHPYESGLVGFIDGLVRPGDRVTVVGGGLGVSTVAAARRAGPDGTVVTFEARRESCEKVRETVGLNEVEADVSVEHAVVEAPGEGVGRGARTLPARELPGCDVLVLDCEGAETAILGNLGGRPRNIVAETHAVYGAPPRAVASLMRGRGYSLLDRALAESAAARQCRRDGIWVLAFEAADP